MTQAGVEPATFRYLFLCHTMVHLSHLQESVLPSSVGDVHAHAPECWSLTHYHCATEPYYTARNGTCLPLKSRRSIARYSYGPRRDDTNRRTVEGALVVRPDGRARECLPNASS